LYTEDCVALKLKYSKNLQPLPASIRWAGENRRQAVNYFCDNVKKISIEKMLEVQVIIGFYQATLFS
jgi:hypothetical protein